MIRKTKLLISILVMSMVLSNLPGMMSYAANVTGEEQTTAEILQDENHQRSEVITAMDKNGNIYELPEENGLVEIKDDTTNEFSFFSVPSVEMKVVNFNTKGNDITEYNNRSGYTNGSCGADAAYLGITADGNIRFMLSGIIGTVSQSEVQILPYKQVADKVSYYIVSNGKLFHYISQNLNVVPSSVINNGTAPKYLNENCKYYSYDGHYFYSDYSVMLSDYQNNTNGKNAVNATNPFYNYFQFRNMREATSYNANELETILNTAMANAGVNLSTSKLTGSAASFVKYQNIYNVNALLSLGIAINESGWGQSWICQNKNNIFGLNAVDTSPGESADTYASIDDCIRVFMKDWMDGGYFDPSDWRNHGEQLGNKAEGINVSYASDPYWGEKAAALAWNLDSIGGNKDYLGNVPSPEVPDVPSTDDNTDNTTPEVPDVPSTDDNTDNTTPEVPDVPSTDDNTDNTTPEVPDVPSTDDNTDNTTPEVPDVPSTDDNTDNTTPEIPDVPSTDDNTDNTTPEIPDVPSADDNTTAITPKDDLTEVSTSNNKFTVKGTLSNDATLNAEALDPNSEQYIQYVSAEEIKGKVVLGVYDINLIGMKSESVDLIFNVGKEYEGKNIIILHYTDNGSYEVYKTTVKNGQVSLNVKGFSPYVFALDEETTTNVSKAPKTGDNGNIALWVSLICGSAALGITMFLKKKKYK